MTSRRVDPDVIAIIDRQCAHPARGVGDDAGDAPHPPVSITNGQKPTTRAMAVSDNRGVGSRHAVE
jgi:hypothetical protein